MLCVWFFIGPRILFPHKIKKRKKNKKNNFNKNKNLNSEKIMWGGEMRKKKHKKAEDKEKKVQFIFFVFENSKFYLGGNLQLPQHHSSQIYPPNNPRLISYFVTPPP